jgi:tRNA G18 (ribose-2'-O)-methylase SpoU
MAQVDELVAIPHAPQVESLNAGVAGSIVLYEAARQRREQG